MPHDVAAPEPVNRSSPAKAAASKTDRGTVERMDTLKRERPDLGIDAERLHIAYMNQLRGLPALLYVHN